MRLRPLVLALALLAGSAALPARAADPPAAAVQQARSAFGAKQFRQAIDLLDPYLAANPRDARAFVLRGDAKASLDDDKGALLDYNKAIAIAPEYQYAYETRCETRLQLDDAAGALADCDVAIRLDPTDGKAYQDRADVYFDREAYAQALADYDKAVALGGSSAYLFAARCDADRLNRKLERAADDCANSLALVPKNRRGLWANGRLALVTARYQDAIANWNSYIGTDHAGSDVAYYWRGTAYNRIGSWKLALEDLQTYVGRKPNDADGYRERAFARAGSGDAAGALADLDEAGRRYRRSGDMRLAEQLAATAKALRAGQPLPALPAP